MNGAAPDAAISPAAPAAATVCAGLHQGGKTAAMRAGFCGLALTATAANRPRKIATVVARISPTAGFFSANAIGFWANVRSRKVKAGTISESLVPQGPKLVF